MRIGWLVLLLSLAGCDEGVTVIDGRGDAGSGALDATVVTDGGADGGVADARVGTDADCERMPPPSPTPWEPVDTGGPAGETLSDCIARVGATTDDRVPDDDGYDLTTFGGPGDEQPVSCGGPDADGSWYYAANAQRFSCGRRVRVVDEARTRCVVVEVADIGPNACVEEAGGRAIWDVSPLAAQHLFGVSSVGWSEHRAVFGTTVDPGNPLGPCDHVDDPDAILSGFIGGACRGAADCTFGGARCLTEAEGYPDGMCTQDCTATCPDRVGPYAFTACAEVDGVGRCLARCDYSLFADGCRPGYGCVERPQPSTGALRSVCLPLSCI